MNHLFTYKNHKQLSLTNTTKNEDGTQNKWTAICETNLETGLTECTYTNSGDSSLQIKVEQPISDGITC